MHTYQCFSCGFQSSDKGIFISSNGDGTFHWLMLICPQCSVANPPIAELGMTGRVAYKEPNWVIDESNYGIYVRVLHEKGGSSAAPMITEHQLWNVIYKEGKTYGQYHAFLVERGALRSEAFKTQMETLQKARVDEKWTMERYLEQMDLARKECLVGDYDTKVTTQPPRL